MGSLAPDVKNQLLEMHNELVKLDDLFGNLEEVDYETVTSQMSAVDRAQYDITIAYAINSLFWLYMRSFGENPKDHKITEEIDRIKAQMRRLQQISDKSKRPQVNKDAAGRMIRHGINLQNKNRKRKVEGDENWEIEQPGTSNSSTITNTTKSDEKKRSKK